MSSIENCEDCGPTLVEHGAHVIAHQVGLGSVSTKNQYSQKVEEHREFAKMVHNNLLMVFVVLVMSPLAQLECATLIRHSASNSLDLGNVVLPTSYSFSMASLAIEMT